LSSASRHPHVFSFIFLCTLIVLVFDLSVLNTSILPDLSLTLPLMAHDYQGSSAAGDDDDELIRDEQFYFRNVVFRVCTPHLIFILNITDNYIF
jgi:hypothetical protein